MAYTYGNFVFCNHIARRRISFFIPFSFSASIHESMVGLQHVSIQFLVYFHSITSDMLWNDMLFL
jgi:hypothetical protein